MSLIQSIPNASIYFSNVNLHTKIKPSAVYTNICLAIPFDYVRVLVLTASIFPSTLTGFSVLTWGKASPCNDAVTNMG